MRYLIRPPNRPPNHFGKLILFQDRGRDQAVLRGAESFADGAPEKCCLSGDVGRFVRKSFPIRPPIERRTFGGVGEPARDSVWAWRVPPQAVRRRLPALPREALRCLFWKSEWVCRKRSRYSGVRQQSPGQRFWVLSFPATPPFELCRASSSPPRNLAIWGSLPRPTPQHQRSAAQPSTC